MSIAELVVFVGFPLVVTLLTLVNVGDVPPLDADVTEDPKRPMGPKSNLFIMLLLEADVVGMGMPALTLMFSCKVPLGGEQDKFCKKAGIGADFVL